MQRKNADNSNVAMLTAKQQEKIKITKKKMLESILERANMIQNIYGSRDIETFKRGTGTFCMFFSTMLKDKHESLIKLNLLNR